MTDHALGARYLTACKALGVDPWRFGMRASNCVRFHKDNLWEILFWCAQGYVVPDLSDRQTLCAALTVYDEVRIPRPTDPVFLTAATHSLTAHATRTALVEALEQLAAERAACGGAP